MSAELNALQSIIGTLAELHDRLARLESKLGGRQPSPGIAFGEREFLTVKEAAAVLGKAPFTTRELCRLGRVNAVRSKSGRGCYGEWRISVQEIRRVLDEGLLPPPGAKGKYRRSKMAR